MENIREKVAEIISLSEHTGEHIKPCSDCRKLADQVLALCLSQDEIEKIIHDTGFIFAKEREKDLAQVLSSHLIPRGVDAEKKCICEPYDNFFVRVNANCPIHGKLAHFPAQPEQKSICDTCKFPCAATHRRANCSMYEPKPIPEQKYCECKEIDKLVGGRCLICGLFPKPANEEISPLIFKNNGIPFENQIQEKIEEIRVAVNKLTKGG